MTAGIHKLFAVVSSTVVVGAVVWGAVLVGSPTTARLQRFDEQRLDDLQTILGEIQLLCRDPEINDQLKRELPDSLDELAVLARSKKIHVTDPETGQRYIYRIKSETTFELCATFAQTRDSDVEVFWNHASGENCFTINALDPP